MGLRMVVARSFVFCTGIALCAAASGQERQLYRYIDADGKVVYSDQLPPPNAKNVQSKRVTANVIDTSEASLASQRASERFPVTLYTFDCGQPCQGAEALLNKRGVPFTTVNVSDPAGSAKVTSLVGSNVAPVLQVGDKLVSKGLNEPRWQAMLDEAGYPRSAAPRRSPPGTGTEMPPVAKASSGPAPAPAADPAAATTSAEPAAPPSTPPPATGGGGYPK
jgi:glutaredoxin